MFGSLLFGGEELAKVPHTSKLEIVRNLIHIPASKHRGGLLQLPRAAVPVGARTLHCDSVISVDDLAAPERREGRFSLDALAGSWHAT
jgi:hypothetical protein